MKNLDAKKFGIGLTGGIATGKSTVANMIRSLGFIVIDADKLSREVTSKNSATLKLIIAEFGKGILQKDGNLDRKKLKEIIFSNPEKKILLESITHPAIENQLASNLKKQLPTSSFETWFYEAALLIEVGKAEHFKELWLTTCSMDIQIKRIMERDKTTNKEAISIINSQYPISKKKKYATTIIDTEMDLVTLKSEIKKLCVRFS